MSLFNKQYDLLVIGGGINGAAIAHLAAKAGVKVALVEKNDWASGTSSKSTKLLHGGIRYLENFEFDLVKESLKERYIQWKAAPHLVKPMRFIIPVYRGQGRPLWEMKLGVFAYDLLSGQHSVGGSSHMSIQDVIHLMPILKSKGLKGAVSYYDAQMDDVRICLENVLMARKYGADVANYTQAIDFIKKDGKAIGARVRVGMNGPLEDIMAKKVIVAAGPWSDVMRRKDSPSAKSALRVTKGVHLVCRGNIGQDAVLLQNNKDKRIFFMIPFEGQILIGTTDTDYTGSTDQVLILNEDIEYLLTQAAQYFPEGSFKKENIIAAFAGLRPLVHEAKSPSQVSRKHVIKKELSDVYYVMGGKYTTYRSIAVDCLSRVLPHLERGLYDSNVFELYGSYLKPFDFKVTALRYGVDTSIVNHLMEVYGSRYEDVLTLCVEDPTLRERLCGCSLTIRAQVKYAQLTEMAQTFDDIYERRLGLHYKDCPSRQCRMSIAEMLGAA